MRNCQGFHLPSARQALALALALTLWIQAPPASGSGYDDYLSHSGSSSSGSGTLSEADEVELLSRKHFAPISSAMTSASAEQESGINFWI